MTRVAKEGPAIGIPFDCSAQPHLKSNFLRDAIFQVVGWAVVGTIAKHIVGRAQNTRMRRRWTWYRMRELIFHHLSSSVIFFGCSRVSAYQQPEGPYN